MVVLECIETVELVLALFLVVYVSVLSKLDVMVLTSEPDVSVNVVRPEETDVTVDADEVPEAAVVEVSSVLDEVASVDRVCDHHTVEV